MTTDRGASTLELAILAPLLFTLALGIVDMGRALAMGVAVSEAAQEGVMYASHDPSSTDEIVNRVRFNSTDPDMDAMGVTIECPGAPDDHISVTVDYELELMTPIIGDMFGGTIVLSKTAIGEIFSEDPCVGS